MCRIVVVHRLAHRSSRASFLCAPLRMPHPGNESQNRSEDRAHFHLDRKSVRQLWPHQLDPGEVWSCPRSTVSEAAGKSYRPSDPPVSCEEAGGSWGSARPFFLSACHWYCALPKVIIVTGPQKNASPFLPAS